MAVAKKKKPAKSSSRAEDRATKKTAGEDGTRARLAQGRQKEIVLKRRGASSPRLLYFPSKTISYRGAQGP